MKIADFVHKKFLKPSKIQVLEVFIDAESNQHFSLSEYENVKDTVVLTEEHNEIKSIEELLLKVKDKTSPLILVVDGKGILIRKLPYSGELPDVLAQRIIPNAKTEDFYMEQVIPNNEHCFVALIRKDAIDKLCELLISNGILITHLHLGPLVSSCISSLLVKENIISHIHWRNYTLSFSTDGLLDIAKSDASEQSSLPFKSEHYLKFATACAHFSDWQQNSVILCDTIKSSGREFSDKKKFKVFTTAMVVFFLVLLLANFFVFQHYWKKQQELEAQAGWKENAAKDFDGLKKSIAEKMSFALETGLLAEDKLAWLADQVGMTVPEEIKLTRLNIYPKEKKVTDDIETYVFNQNYIQIDGYSPSETAINEWIKAIKEQEFASKIRLGSFMHDHDKETGIFKLLIELKD